MAEPQCCTPCLRAVAARPASTAPAWWTRHGGEKEWRELGHRLSLISTAVCTTTCSLKWEETMVSTEVILELVQRIKLCFSQKLLNCRLRVSSQGTTSQQPGGPEGTGRERKQETLKEGPRLQTCNVSFPFWDQEGPDIMARHYCYQGTLQHTGLDKWWTLASTLLRRRRVYQLPQGKYPKYFS